MADQPSQNFSIDFSNVADRVAAPAGEYTVEVVSSEMRISGGEKTKGSQMLFLHLKVVESEHDSHLFENLILHNDSMWRVKQFFKAMGLIDANGQVQMATDELVGARCRAKLTTEIWSTENGGDGELRNRVARFLPIQGAQPAAESLADMFTE